MRQIIDFVFDIGLVSDDDCYSRGHERQMRRSRESKFKNSTSQSPACMPSISSWQLTNLTVNSFKDFANEYGIPRAYGSYEVRIVAVWFISFANQTQMNNRSTISVLAFHNDSHTHAKELFQDADVDAIYVPLPTAIRKPVGIMSLVFQGKRQNRLHVFQLLMCMQWVLKAANAKKHVLCEKPVAPNAADALEMIRACRNNGEGCMSIASPNATLVQSIEMQARKINSTRLALILYVQMCCLWTTRCSCTTLGSRPCPSLCMTQSTTSTGYIQTRLQSIRGIEQFRVYRCPY